MSTGKAWVEKYRPETLDDIVGQETNIKVLKSFAKQVQNGVQELPHFLFSGPTGNGKTSSARCFAKALFGERWDDNFVDYNASNERGIDTVRDKIKKTANWKSIGEDGFKIIFLDEADALTKPALNALRRIVEDTSAHTKFIFSCNHRSKIIDAIKGRCQELVFVPVMDKDIVINLKRICKAEDLHYEGKALELIAKKSQGKVRNSVGHLQQIATANGGVVNEENVRMHIFVLTKDEIQDIFGIINQRGSTKEKMKKIDEEIYKLYYTGYSAEDILSEIYDYIVTIHPENVRTLAKIGDIDSHISQGANPLLQLRCFMAWLLIKMEE